MPEKSFIVLLLFIANIHLNAQQSDVPDYMWGHSFYYNMNIGDELTFNGEKIQFLNVKNHFNLLQIGEDTLLLKVARRSVPVIIRGVRVFIADNKTVKGLTTDTLVHRLLTKDALVCLSDATQPLLDPEQFQFPVGFNEGYVWSIDDAWYPFAFHWDAVEAGNNRSFPGFGMDMRDFAGHRKHRLVAIENSTVIKVVTHQAFGYSVVMLKSELQPEIYYLYDRLDSRNLPVKEGQVVMKGDIIGTTGGNDLNRYFHFAVLQASEEPDFEEGYAILNGFPQLFELYFQRLNPRDRLFSRGRIVFGDLHKINMLNVDEYAFYSGKGWIFGTWNPASRVEWTILDGMGNVRVKRVLFENTPAQAENPKDHYEYQIKVREGVYRIRARVGDLVSPSWQQLEFEGVKSKAIQLTGGCFEWTDEYIVVVDDEFLTLKIYYDKSARFVAGISEIVFQKID